MEVHKILSRFKFDWRNTSRPPVAIEIASHGVLAASLSSPGQTPRYAFSALEPGVIVPGTDEANLRSPAAVSDAIRSALERVAPSLDSVTLVLPDATTRVFLLEFDSLPEGPAEIAAVLRLRLRKVLPFDAERTQVSYQMLPRQGAKLRVLAAIIPAPILAEYEAAVEAAGYKAGSALPAGLAALAAFHSSQPALIACLSDHSLTTSITNCGDLLLYRTHALSKDPVEKAAELKRDITVAAAYFEDQLMSRPKEIHFSGAGTAEEFARLLAAPETPVVDLAPKQQNIGAALSADIDVAGVVGALAGAR